VIEHKTDTPVTGYMGTDWEAGHAGVTVEYEHPNERSAAWRYVAAEALRTAAMIDAVQTADDANAALDDPAARLTWDEVRGIRDGYAVREAVRLAAQLAADAGNGHVARTLGALLRENLPTEGVTL
jgi:hypothetical protein